MEKIINMEKIRILGSGGQAKIFLVKSGEQYFACKESCKVEALEREGMFLQLADHERFVKFVDYQEKEGKGFLVMEYVSGSNLGSILCEEGGMDTDRAMRILLEVAEGIAFLHSMRRPVIHRDIKPENIMINREGRVKLIDMGCACFVKETGGKSVGTKGYAPAEQMDLSGLQGTYSDVYAFGRLMHYLLTGDNPYLPPFEKPDIRKYDRSFAKNLACLVEACVREKSAQRLPDMRYVLHELKKIEERRNTRRHFTIGGRFGIHQGEFVYEKNILMK